MKNIIYRGVFLSLITVTFIGCKKDNLNSFKNVNNNSSNFNSIKELKAKIKELEHLSEEERRAYESQNDYKSLYTHALEIYEKIDMNTLEDIEILKNHVNKNHDILEIAKEESGELVYRTFYSDNPYSLVANKSRMIIVDDFCIKIFDDGLISTSINNFDILKNIKEKSVEKINLNDDFNISYYKSHDINIKSNCSSYREDRKDNNRDRTKLWVETYYENISGMPYVTGRGQIRPYKKTLGIWYFARRTITGRIKFDVTYTLNGQNIVRQFNENVPANLSYTQSRGFNDITWPDIPSNIRFTHINSWGDTPSTSTAIITCN